LGRTISNKEQFLVEMRQMNIQPVKKATFSFDPMRNDFTSIRHFMYFFHKPKVLEKNLKIAIKTEVLDDRTEPMIKLELNDGRVMEIKTSNLTELEILRVCNYYLLPLVTEEKVMETKSSKGAGSGGKKVVKKK
jgi:hypothetical protein